MKLFLDTEFNGAGGPLLSMALVTEDGREWYEVLGFPPGCLDPWVREHVMPKLEKDSIPDGHFLASFHAFISQLDGCEVIADWPADFEHFSRLMSDVGQDLNFRIPIECTMRLVRGDDTIQPENPHNALSDARALRDWYFRRLRTGKTDKLRQSAAWQV